MAMLQSMTLPESEQVLLAEYVGRLGCYEADPNPQPSGSLPAREEPFIYVVPVSYVYDQTERCIYSYLRDGRKVRMLERMLERKPVPTVCFEVERVDSPANWRSVLVWGTCEELHGPDADLAMRLLVHRLTPVITSATSLPPAQSSSDSKPRGRVYCIRLNTQDPEYMSGVEELG